MAYLEDSLILKYFERLISENKSKTLFIEQFLHGSGNELKDKFWSDRSSSRLCFDMYSWLCQEPNILEFQFEKQLPGVKTGINRVSGAPNMDVYFELEKDIVFIESKYTEKDSWKYKNDKIKEGFHLSEAYWEQGCYKSCKLNNGERFYDESRIAGLFSQFCEEIQSLIDKKKNTEEHSKYRWFDPKQETCHLFGIIFYVLLKKVKGKHIHLCNNVWRCNEDCFDLSNSIVGEFKKKAEKMLNGIFYKFNCEFTFEVHTIQDILSNGFMNFNFANAKLFANNKETVKDYIESHYKNINRK